MVKIMPGVLGLPSGKSGNVVYRKMNGKLFASYRPDRYNASQSKAAVANRNKFGTTVTFAKYINALPILKLIWKTADIQGYTSFNRLIKHNVLYTSETGLSLSNHITPKLPDLPTMLSVNEFSLINDCVNINFAVSSDKMLPAKGLLFFVVALQQPKQEDYTPVEFFHINENLNSLSNGKSELLELPLTRDEKKAMTKYKSCICYAAVIFEPSSSKNIMFTNTVSKEFDINNPLINF